MAARMVCGCPASSSSAANACKPTGTLCRATVGVGMDFCSLRWHDICDNSSTAAGTALVQHVGVWDGAWAGVIASCMAENTGAGLVGELLVVAVLVQCHSCLTLVRPQRGNLTRM